MPAAAKQPTPDIAKRVHEREFFTCSDLLSKKVQILVFCWWRRFLHFHDSIGKGTAFIP
jgi:hypothetical protein